MTLLRVLGLQALSFAVVVFIGSFASEKDLLHRQNVAILASVLALLGFFLIRAIRLDKARQNDGATSTLLRIQKFAHVAALGVFALLFYQHAQGADFTAPTVGVVVFLICFFCYLVLSLWLIALYGLNRAKGQG